MLFLNKWKWLFLSVAFLTYSVLVWDISGRISDNTHLRDQVKQQERFIEIQADNNKLRDDIAKMLAEAAAKQRQVNADANKELLNEILKDPVYQSCRVTDGVRNAIKRKLDSQAK